MGGFVNEAGRFGSDTGYRRYRPIVPAVYCHGGTGSSSAGLLVSCVNNLISPRECMAQLLRFILHIRTGQHLEQRQVDVVVAAADLSFVQKTSSDQLVQVFGRGDA